jgi:hypothetical protein
MDKIGRLLGDRGVELPARPDFAKQFLVASDDPAAAARCLSGPAADWLTKSGDVTLEVREGDVIAQRYQKLAKPDEYAKFLGELTQVVQALKGAR